MTPDQRNAVLKQMQATMRHQLEAFVAPLDETPVEPLEGGVQQVRQQRAHQLLHQSVQAISPRHRAPPQPAVYQRQRAATVRTVVGPITYRRAYYLCPACQHGAAPLEQALGWCAGSLSASLQQQAVVRGASLPYAQASQVLATLTHVSAATIRRATLLVGHQLDTDQTAPTAVPAREPLSVSAAGCMVYLRQEGWQEVRVGGVHTSRPRYTAQGLVPHAEQPHYVAVMGDLAAFGERLWQCRGAWSRWWSAAMVLAGLMAWPRTTGWETGRPLLLPPPRSYHRKGA